MPTILRYLLYAVAFTPLISIHGDLPGIWNATLAPFWLVYFPNITGKAVFAHVLIDIAIICYVFVAWRNPELRPRNNILLYVLGGYIGAMLVSAVFGVSLNRSLWGTFQRGTGVMDIVYWTAYAVMLGGLLNGETNEEHRPQTRADLRRRDSNRGRINRDAPAGSVSFGVRFLALNIDVAFFIALIALSQWIVEPRRVGSTLDNPIYLGGYSMVMAMMAMKLLWEKWHDRQVDGTGKDNACAGSVRIAKKRGRAKQSTLDGNIPFPAVRFFDWRIGYSSVPVALLITAVFLSGSRSSVLALGIAVLTLGVLYVYSRRSFVNSHLVCVDILRRHGFRRGVSVGLAICGLLSAGFFMYRGASPFQQGGWTDRQYAIETGLRAWQFRPLTGYGPENFTAAFSRYADPQRLTRPELQFDSAHNHYVDALVETGVIGLAATLVLTGVVAWHLRRDGFMLAAWLGLTVQLFFLFDTPALNLVWAILIGVAISQVKTQEESHERIRETVARTKNRRTPANLHL